MEEIDISNELEKDNRGKPELSEARNAEAFLSVAIERAQVSCGAQAAGTFTLEFEDGLLFEKAIKLASAYIDEATLAISQDGLKLHETDPSQICLIGLEIPKMIFKRFELQGQEQNVGVDMDLLLEILQGSKNKTIRLQDAAGDRIEITANNLVTQSMPVLDLIKNELPKPKLDFKASITVKRKEFAALLKDLNRSFKTVELTASQSGLLLAAENSQTSAKAGIVLAKDNPIVVEINAAAGTSAQYPLHYLLPFAEKCLADAITLEFSQDTPIKITGDLPGLKASIWIANRVRGDI